MAPIPNAICPKCKQADQVQQVSHVYDANTKEWVEDEFGTDVRGRIESRQVQHEAHTKLGLKLKPPEEPDPPRNPALWYGIGIGMAVIILLGLCPFIVVPLAIVIPIALGNSSTLPEAFRGQGGTTLTAVIMALILIGGLIVLGFLVWARFTIKRHYDRSMAGYRAKKEAYEQDQLRPYQRAKERWEQLYYCSRDEIVFIPIENIAVPIEDMEKYLYDPYYRLQEGH
jgi:hypothetical protein